MGDDGKRETEIRQGGEQSRTRKRRTGRGRRIEERWKDTHRQGKKEEGIRQPIPRLFQDWAGIWEIWWREDREKG